MCGIYLSNIQIHKDLVKKKLDLISHRGPDDQNIIKVDNLILGHVRLSILDLDGRSSQPMTYLDKTIVYNGEIYNYKDVREKLIRLGYEFDTTGDTEVLLKGYYEWQENLLNEINGMFAFAIYSSKSNQVFFARDRMGVKPLYYYYKNGNLEISSTLDIISNKNELKHKAINVYLQTGYIPSPLTIFEGVQKVLPGTFIKIDLDKNEFYEHVYWDLSKVKPKKISYDKAKKKLKQLLDDAVRIRMSSDVPIGCFLSGGIDSALVSSIASKYSDRKLKTYTIGIDESPSFDETGLAENYAKILNTNHTTIQCKKEELINLIDELVKKYDEPFGDSSAIPSLLINKKAKPHVTVVLSGDGGDESFLGYNHFSWAKKIHKVFFIPLFIRKILVNSIPRKLFKKKGKRILSILGYKNFEEFILKVFIGFDQIVTYRETNWTIPYLKYLRLSKNFLQKLADLNIKLWLENDSNVKVDRASMASSVEVRSPFLDYRIIEFSRSLPINHRYSNWNRKKILKDILAEYIPKNLFDRPKKGFSIPIKDWIRNELKDDINNAFKEKNLSKIPSLNYKKLIRFLNLHMSGKEDFSYEIWRVYILIKWLKRRKLIDLY